MLYEKSSIKLLKAIINADLTKSEIKILTHLLDKHDKTITAKNSEISQQIKMQTTNVIRNLKALEDKNVIGYRHNTNNMYVKSVTSWKNQKQIKKG